MAYLSIGVGTDGDGQIDKEYIIYRYNTAGGNGVIISMYFDDPDTGDPVVVCTVSSAGVCTPADPRFVVVNAGSRPAAATISGATPCTTKAPCWRWRL